MKRFCSVIVPVRLASVLVENDRDPRRLRLHLRKGDRVIFPGDDLRIVDDVTVRFVRCRPLKNHHNLKKVILEHDAPPCVSFEFLCQ